MTFEGDEWKDKPAGKRRENQADRAHVQEGADQLPSGGVQSGYQRGHVCQVQQQQSEQDDQLTPLERVAQKRAEIFGGDQPQWPGQVGERRVVDGAAGGISRVRQSVVPGGGAVHQLVRDASHMPHGEQDVLARLASTPGRRTIGDFAGKVGCRRGAGRGASANGVRARVSARACADPE